MSSEECPKFVAFNREGWEETCDYFGGCTVGLKIRSKSPLIIINLAIICDDK